MIFRSLMACSALAIGLAACSGESKQAEESAAADTPAMSSPVAAETPVEDPAAVAESPAADAEATDREAAPADKPSPTPTPTPTPTSTPAPEKVVEAAPPASFGRCAVCHTVNKGGENKLGPNLYGVYGTVAGQGGFAYSAALKDSGLTWDDATLNSWLENPRALVPGNRMSFPGLKDAAKRQEIIDYLKKQR